MSHLARMLTLFLPYFATPLPPPHATEGVHTVDIALEPHPKSIQGVEIL